MAKIEFKVTIIPVVFRDESSGIYSAKLPDFPELIAYGHSESESVMRLKAIFQLMLEEHPKDVRDTLFRAALKVRHNANVTPSLSPIYPTYEGKVSEETIGLVMAV